MRLNKPNPDLDWEAVEKVSLLGPEHGFSEERPCARPERPTVPASALARALVEYEWALRSLLSADAGLPEPESDEETTRETLAVGYPAPRASEVRELGKSLRRAG